MPAQAATILRDPAKWQTVRSSIQNGRAPHLVEGNPTPRTTGNSDLELFLFLDGAEFSFAQRA
jgi:hypothetical protein